MEHPRSAMASVEALHPAGNSLLIGGQLENRCSAERPLTTQGDIRGSARYARTMTGKGSLDEQVAANLPEVKVTAPFAANRLWLTFYLCGPPDRLRSAAEALAAEGWQNTGDWEGRSSTPRSELSRMSRPSWTLRGRCKRSANMHTVDVPHIDADTRQM
jgi:hypothetical protein